MLKWFLNRLRGDKIIWITVLLISMISVLAIYSATSSLAYRTQGENTEFYIFSHLIHILMALGVMFAIHLVNYRVFAQISNILLIVTIPLLLYTVLQGSEHNEAARWITIFGQSFQPSDLAKLTLMIYLAKVLTQRQDVIKNFSEGFLPSLFWVTVICGLIAPENGSTAVLMFCASLMVMFIAGVDTKYIGIMILTGLFASTILYNTAKRSNTWKSRINDWVSYMTQEEYEAHPQRAQASIAVATGGLLGKGVGKSSQRNFIPEAHSDFVYAIIIEEYGMIGGLLVILLYLVLLVRAVSIVTVSKTFGALMAAGLSFLLVLQALTHIGINIGLLPVSGVTLPLISMGGTSVIFTGISLGIILSVSRDAIEKGRKSKVSFPRKFFKMALK